MAANILGVLVLVHFAEYFYVVGREIAVWRCWNSWSNERTNGRTWTRYVKSSVAV